MDKPIPECWPFLDEASGGKIQENKFYGFSDAGGLAGSFDGYDSRNEALAAMVREGYFISDVGINPEDLGSESITVLSGREYVDRLKTLEPGPNGWLEVYGKWSDA